MSTAFIGRQPIYSEDLQIAAYEVLFRNSAENFASIKDGDQATAELIFNLLSEIGFEQIVGEHPAFINITRNFILDGHALALPKDRVVLEVLEDIKPEPDVIDALRSLSEQGYKIALDDFVYSPELQPLIELADIIKVELPAIPVEELAEHVSILREREVKLLAEKVETHEEFERCKELGFDYFQGYFFCKPKVIQGKRVPVNKVAALRLLTKLTDSNADVGELTSILSTEPSLCYKLLRFVNSASCSLTHHVDSIRTAITLVGLKRLNAFVRLAVLAETADDKAPYLITTALTRGRMCELLARSARRPRPEMYFVAGLFTVLDALLDQPMQDALSSLPLDVEIQKALLSNEGPMADIVQCSVSYDQADFDRVHLEDIDAPAIRMAYFEAVAWTAEAALSAEAML